MSMIEGKAGPGQGFGAASRNEVLETALQSGLCFELMIDRMIARISEGRP